jgi:hypothetical protein
MNRWFDPLQKYLDARSLREKWLIAGSLCIAAVLGVQSAIVSPLLARRDAALARREQLDAQLLQARRLAAEFRRLQGGVEAVEARLATAPRIDLRARLEQLALAATIRAEQLESIKPTPVSGNSKYPETRVQVDVRGASLAQTVRFLHAIETSDSHLILRSVQIRKGRAEGGVATLDTTLSVSSFQKG